MCQKIMTATVPFAVLAVTAVIVSPAKVLAAPIDCTDPANKEKIACTPLGKDINQIVNFLAAAVGIVVVGSIIYGGIQYIMAGDNPQAVGAAKERITNSLIALIAFGFSYAFVQWLVPGGVF